MTTNKLLEGISAVKIINSTIVAMCNDNNKVYCKKIQGCLDTLVDVLQEVFVDMVKDDILLEKGMSVD